jgi:hypothetical protein
MALLAAAVKVTKGKLDAGSFAIVDMAFSDLTSRGYSRHEAEKVFRRIKQRLIADPDIPDDANA